MTDRYFPIKQTPACPLKWNWSTIWCTEGVSASCHRNKQVPVDLDDFDNSLHNHPHKIKEREIMLSGKWPTVENGGSGHCNYCKSIEDAGGTSDRMHMKTMPDQVPIELQDDPTATVVTPTIFEMFISATCNLQCTYCNTKNSSKINAEARKYGEIVYPDGTKPRRTHPYDNHPRANEYFEKTLDYIDRHGNKLKRLHLLGGEPFYMRETKKVYERLANLKNRNLEFQITTNLMSPHFMEHIESIKKLIKDKNIGRFDICCSIDSWGEEAEYARHGLKCDTWLKNFDHVIKEKWIYITTQACMTTLTLRSYHKLLQVLNERRKIRKIHNEHGFVIGRDMMHPKIYGGKFWEQDFKNALNEMPNNDANDQTLKSYWYGMWKSIKDEKMDRDLIDKGKFYFDTLDQRRNLNWRKVFPYLDI